ncbi:LAMI_0H15852g1_1 [Lachancea mirantina]|uniref:DNA polymerase epsilon subunit D n=1 Tax=Lachancea mirantina TaxID=1230905 RepID=A0A1G4KJ43_9SACH|nr:LAMI_0H15852g1_1 [Lachancea mirantina]
MAPKSRKEDAQNVGAGTGSAKDQENVSIDDLLFPKSTIMALAREAATPGIDENAESTGKKLILSKDAVTALQRSATVFVNHLLMYAREEAHSQDRKNCNVTDILEALVALGFVDIKPVVQEKVEAYQQMLNLRKAAKVVTTDRDQEMKDVDGAEEDDDDENDEDEMEEEDDLAEEEGEEVPENEEGEIHDEEEEDEEEEEEEGAHEADVDDDIDNDSDNDDNDDNIDNDEAGAAKRPRTDE